jgi:GNAT superfamily N-acetyltransferase
MTFAKGASLEDPSGLFNSSLEGNTRRAIDIHESDKIDEKALKALIRAAVALNTSKRETARPVRPQKRPDIHPLTPDRWDDLVNLFGLERGANSGCWCMWPRMPGKDFKAMPREARREAFRRIVGTGPPPGLLAYEEGVPVGWVAVGPRPTLARFNAGKTSRPVEGKDEPDPARIHAISCFYIRPGHRKRGLMGRLAEAAVDFAKRSGAAAVEVCAIEPEKHLQWGEGYVGVASVFRPLGFEEVARRSPRRPLMRRILR